MAGGAEGDSAASSDVDELYRNATTERTKAPVRPEMSGAILSSFTTAGPPSRCSTVATVADTRELSGEPDGKLQHLCVWM